MSAVALRDGDVGPAQFEPAQIVRRDVQSLVKRVAIRPSRLYTWRYPYEMCCKVAIQLKDGGEFSTVKTGYEGFYTTPMTWKRVVEKFVRLTEKAATPVLQKSIVSAVEDLEDAPITQLTRLLAKVAAPRRGRSVRAARG